MRWLTKHQNAQASPPVPRDKRAELLAQVDECDRAAVLAVADALHTHQAYPPNAALEAAVMRYRRAHGIA